MPLVLWTTERREGKAEKVVPPGGWREEVVTGIVVSLRRAVGAELVVELQGSSV